MKNNLSLSDHISSSVLEKIRTLENIQGGDFNEYVRHFGLDPTKDFRNADLTHINFDGCDLRAFDFSGADLRGAVGRDVTWDSTTKLDGAQVSGSIFAYEKYRDQFFSANPHWHKRFTRLKVETWANASIWIAENIGTGNQSKGESLEVAKALFEVTTDSVLKTNILLFMSRAFDSLDQHRDYLLHILAKHGSNKRVLSATVTTLGSLFANDLQVANLFRHIVIDPTSDYHIRLLAFQALLRSKHLGKILSDISTGVGEFNAEMRRLYVKKIASIYGKAYVDAVREPFGDYPLDFKEQVTNAKILNIARRDLRDAMAAEARNKLSEFSVLTLPEPKERDVRAHAALVKSRIVTLTKSVPFQIEEGDFK